MAKRTSIASKELQLFIVGPFEAFKASRVQRLSLNADIPSTTVDEIGSASHVGNVQDLPNVTLTFSAMDVGIKIFSALTGTNPAAYPAAGVDISSLGEIDAIMYVKDVTTNDYVKTIHARKLQIRDFTFTYNADGESTEDYTAIGSERRYFSKEVTVDKLVAAGVTQALTQTPLVLKNGRYLLSVIMNGVYLTEVAGAPATGEYRVTLPTTLTTGDALGGGGIIMAVYQSDPVALSWADVGDATMPVAIRGKDVPVKIGLNSIPRVQSVTINGTLNTQTVREMGNRQIVGSTKQVPEVTGTIAVLDTDLELTALLQYGVLASGTEYFPGEGCVVSGASLSIQLLDPCDDTLPYTVIKEVYIDGIIPTGDAFAGNVNQNTTLNFNWKSTYGHCKVYSGARP